MTEQTATAGVLAVGLAVLAWWVLALLLDHTRRTVRQCLTHGAAALAACALTVAHAASDTVHHLTQMRGPR
jgi:hypothetical protein